MRKALAALPFLVQVCVGDIPAHLVEQIPGFDKTDFKVYSGLLDVPGPINGYDSLKVHYQFHLSQRSPSSDPVVAWHQGGPGGSAMFGAYLEMGYFQIDDAGKGYVNEFAWNRVANMLYLESPAGSGGSAGYSQCIKGGRPVACEWNDRNQGEAYAHTLLAFRKAFQEFSANPLYLSGESYFGIYGPNIAHYILNHEPFASKLGLAGMLVGNGCWGGSETSIECNGPNRHRNDVELRFGKGLISPKLHAAIYQSCAFPDVSNATCQAMLAEMRRQVGPHDVYNLYDSCPTQMEFLEKTGKDTAWLVDFLRDNLHDPMGAHQQLLDMSGGFPYTCKSMGQLDAFLTDPQVRKALHLADVPPGASSFHYRLSGPASKLLYPELVKKIPILIFNGDADSCVPYNGNEEWIGDLESDGVLEEKAPWTPWYTSNTNAPAGYVTLYSVPGSSQEFAFKTVRLAGHMVPEFRPEAGFVLFRDFLQRAETRAKDVVV